MKQLTLAQKFGIKSNLINNWKYKRTRPDHNHIPKIFAALEIGFYELFGVDNPMKTYSNVERTLIKNYCYLNEQNRSVVRAVLSTPKERQQAENCPPITFCRKVGGSRRY